MYLLGAWAQSGGAALLLLLLFFQPLSVRCETLAMMDARWPGSGSQLCLREGSAHSQAALTRCSSVMEWRLLGAAFIKQIRTRAHSLGVRVSQSKKKTHTPRILPAGTSC